MPPKVSLPTFWPNNAAVWFVRAEQEWVIKSISTQATKYAYLVSALSEEVSMRVADKLVGDLSATHYDDLKQHLLKVYTKSDYEKAKLLLDLPQLGDNKPSELMNKMLSYLPAGVDTADPGFLFRAIFLERMPTDIRAHLVALKTETMTALADKADELFASRVVPSFMLDQTFDDIPQHADDVPVCAARNSPVDSSTQCWYHATFGASASKCRAPCSYRPPAQSSQRPPAGNGQRRRRKN